MGGGLFNQGRLQTRNTILAGNTVDGPGQNSGPDLSGDLGSLGHNLLGISADGTGYDVTDLLDLDPQLGPLQDNGGLTQTMALLCGSPAIDAGDNTDAPDFDQRGEGYPRIVNGIIDLGAYEVQDGECGVTPTETSAHPRLAALGSALTRRVVYAWTVTETQPLAPEVANMDRLFASLGPGDFGLHWSPKRDRRAETGPWMLDGPSPDA
jgi:hypothetical protein